MSFFPKQHSSRAGVTQRIAFDESADIKNAFGVETYQIRLVSDSACCYRIGDGKQTATLDDAYLPAGVIDFVIVAPGQRIAVRKVSAEGTLWVTEML